MAANFKFYMQEVEWNGSEYATIGEPKDLEKDFDGLRYEKCQGLDAIGSARIYKEEYADSDRLRVFIPTELTNEATEVNLSLYFIGENRRKTFDSFCEYIRKGCHLYYDNVRKKKLYFYVEKPIKINEDENKGSKPYINAIFTLQNIFGKTSEATI
jgi:hypothetical protein